ncbi:ABC transporter permease [Glycomyces buryatensis]|uniref:ABC transporter permease n=1 Tax=Glycomyces buryatensis TaxID=2570927 RepID=A0A4S8Q2Z1_9ACTN|nr:ABC-2 family transporter protein [Glycomyces buryatensis]THV38533.1 hypothetical protein FAB82_19000 [Glycomyces buryatensis]
MTAIAHAGGVYRRSIVAQLRAIVEYPADFWIMAASGAFWQILQFAFLSVLFSQVPVLAGWAFPEMLMLAGFLGLAAGANALLSDGAWSTGSMVIKGDMDYRITRPAPVLIQVASAHIGMQGVGEFALGTAMLVYGWIAAGVSPAFIPAAVLFVACAAAINLGLVTAACGANFWIKGTGSYIAFLLVDLQGKTMSMPLKIFPFGVKAFVTFVVPLAFVNFVPVEVLTGRASTWWIVGPPLAAVFSIGLAALVYRAGLRAYDSAGH